MITTFEQYTNTVRPLAKYPVVGENVIYPSLGLAGEAAESLEKIENLRNLAIQASINAGKITDRIKKQWRDFGVKSGEYVTPDTRESILKELGDQLWYIDAQAEELGSSLGEIANMNVDKLLSRHQRGTLTGEGDNR